MRVFAGLVITIGQEHVGHVLDRVSVQKSSNIFHTES